MGFNEGLFDKRLNERSRWTKEEERGVGAGHERGGKSA